MGWGSTLAGIGQIAGGAALIGFTGGAAAGPGAALIGSGVSTIGGGMAADASREAAEEQQASARQAQSVSSGLYDQARQTQHDAYVRGQQGLAPFQGLATAATTNLGSLMGFGALPMPAAIPPLAPSGQMTGTPSGQVVQGAIPRPESMPIDGMGSTPGNVRAPNQTPQQQNAQIQTASAYGGNTLGGLAGVVKLRAPNGDEMAFPAGHPNIQKALSMGATQV